MSVTASCDKCGKAWFATQIGYRCGSLSNRTDPMTCNGTVGGPHIDPTRTAMRRLEVMVLSRSTLLLKAVLAAVAEQPDGHAGEAAFDNQREALTVVAVQANALDDEIRLLLQAFSETKP